MHGYSLHPLKLIYMSILILTIALAVHTEGTGYPCQQLWLVSWSALYTLLQAYVSKRDDSERASLVFKSVCVEKKKKSQFFTNVQNESMVAYCKDGNPPLNGIDVCILLTYLYEFVSNHHSLIPRPRPAFHHLHAVLVVRGGRAWEQGWCSIGCVWGESLGTRLVQYGVREFKWKGIALSLGNFNLVLWLS